MDQRAGVLATILSGVLFGTSVPVIKLGLGTDPLNPTIPPIIFVTLRFALASAFILLLLRKKGWVSMRLLKSKLMWAIGLVNMAGYILQFEGQVQTRASDAALIIGSAALMIPVIALLRHTERVPRRRGLGVLIGFVGTVFVVASGGTDGSVSPAGNLFLGDLLILGTAVTIAMIFVFSKDLVKAYGDRATTGGLLLTTTLLLLLAVPLDLAKPTSLSVDSWLYVVFLATFSTVGSYYFFARGLETVTPTVSSIILPIEVVVSLGLSVLIFQDPFNMLSGTGAGLIVLGVLAVSLSS